MPAKVAKASKGSRKSPRKCGKGVKRVAFKASKDSKASGGYVVPGDDVADEDLEFDFLDWSTCQRSRGLDVSLSVRTRILLACHACDHLDRNVLVESWERSGLIPFDPERVLSTLTDEEEELGDRRKSGRVKSKESAAAICALAAQYQEGSIDDQQLIIQVKEIADEAVCYHVTQSTGAVAAKGIKSGAIAAGWDKKKRKVSKTDKFRAGSFQAEQYDLVEASLAEEAETLNRLKPWECKVAEKAKKGKGKAGKVCGHRLKSTAGLTKHSTAKHHGIGNYYNHATGEIKTFATGDALAAVQHVDAAEPFEPAAAASSSRRQKCVCGGSYIDATREKHNDSAKHKSHVAAAS
jgi:hypothetical protein